MSHPLTFCEYGRSFSYKYLLIYKLLEALDGKVINNTVTCTIRKDKKVSHLAELKKYSVPTGTDTTLYTNATRRIVMAPSFVTPFSCLITQSIPKEQLIITKAGKRMKRMSCTCNFQSLDLFLLLKIIYISSKVVTY